MLVMGSTVVVLAEVSNSEGVWLRLSRESMEQHCFSAEGEAWSLARTSSLAPEVVYLRHESELMQSGDSDEEAAPAKSAVLNHANCWTGPKGYAFSVSTKFSRYSGLFTFGSGTSDPEGGSSGSASPFVFGSPASTPSTSTNALAESERTDPLSERSDPPTSSGSTSGPAPHHPQPRHWTRMDSPPPPTRSLPPELRGVSVRDLVRAIGESRANGNGVTPPGTPPNTPPVRRRQSSATSPNPAMNPVLHPVTIPALRPNLKPTVATSTSAAAAAAVPAATRVPASPQRLPAEIAPMSGEAPATHFASRGSRTPAAEPFRQGMSPSVAECLRAVFAAFLWHEGVVHDAMACASYLKDASPTPEEAVSDLPRALHYLVLLWDQVTSACMQAIKEQLVLPSLFAGTKTFQRIERPFVRGSERRKAKKKRDYRSSNPNARHSGAVAPLGAQGSIGDQEMVCELCGIVCTHPVTYHMRQAHPGCGDHAGGKGYNSAGLFCGGWAGNCGDGGVASSSWYLVCDRCREKFLRQAGASTAHRRSSGSGRPSTGDSILTAAVARMLSPSTQDNVHRNMKSNAIFLLELSSSGPRSRRSGLPSLSETDAPMPSNPFAVTGPIQFFNTLGTAATLNGPVLGFGEDYLPPEPGASVSQPIESEAESTAALNGNEAAADDNFAGERGDEAGPCPAVGGREGARVFHRSVSVGLTHLDWTERDLTEMAPSAALTKLVSSELESSAADLTVQRPVMQFVLQRQDLDTMRVAIQQSLRKATCRVYAMQAFNWLLRNVTQPTCLHDLLWCLVTALSPPVPERPEEDAEAKEDPSHRKDGGSAELVSSSFPSNIVRLAARSEGERKHECTSEGGVGRGLALGEPMSGADVAPAGTDIVNARTDVANPGADAASARTDLANAGTEQQDKEAPCEHPLSDMVLAGEACCGPLRASFHALLQTVSDLMVFLPAGAALQQMAMQCWRLRFLPSDHAFLHRSHVFSNISRILSHSEEEAAAGAELAGLPATSTTAIEVLRDLTPLTEVKASSRQAMANSLSDNSTETFWESGDEDRNKTKVLTLSCSPQARPSMVCVHVDNCRDLANKVNSITFKFGPNQEEMQKLKQLEVESRFAGWLSCILPESSQPAAGVGAATGCVWRLELRGPDNTLRLRQVKVLGHGVEAGPEPEPRGDCRSLRIQQRNCEAETLRVFRLLTSQVFGKLLGGEGEEEEAAQARPAAGEEAVSPERPETSNDLKEHMVGILFSRSKLTHLQKQVCSHIVAALKKEASRVREEWETLLCSGDIQGSGATPRRVPEGVAPASGGDTYCFEMLSMVLALSGSAVGRVHLSQQAGLLRDIFSLLHTGSARVQRQVSALLRRILPEVPPPVLATILGVPGLPPSEYGVPPATPDGDTAGSADFGGAGASPLDMHRAGLLDVLLACVAKALTVQAKAKGGRGAATTLATSIHPRDPLGARWWLRGSVSRKLAQGIVTLLRDMAAGKLTEAWARVTKGAIAENILNFTKIDEKYRTPSECLKTPTLWLALASLCVLDQEHVDRLSSGQWVKSRGDGLQAPPRPTCNNHDDGETPAIILCNVCGNVCADCDRFLHLHRRTKIHQRQVFKEEEEAIKVDLHEGCGRTKLFWVMALADSKTLKAMVEFRETTRGGSSTGGVCRFCGAPGATELLSSGNACSDCREHAVNACSKTHACGHLCNGIRGEVTCLPCLHGCGTARGLRQDADDMCMICFSEALSCAPAIQLSCGHVFHYHCCKTVLSRSWSGPRITFSFSLCPICKA
ncbi:unnamed protein product, partial [Ixodes hexagonus]